MFSSNRSDGNHSALWWSSRPALKAPWSPAQKINRPVDSAFDVSGPTLSTDGQTIIYSSYGRTGGQGKNDLWLTRRVLKLAAASRAADPNKFTNTLGMEFVRVPQGKSWLGGGGGKPGTQEVTIPEDFYLGKYEVTQEEWKSVLGTNPSGFKAVAGVANDVQKQFPVEQISWNDTEAFLRKLNERDHQTGWEYRLPTTAEWEYACRGGPLATKGESSFHYYLGQPSNTLPADKANFVASKWKRPKEVGSYPPNQLGLFDMHGNVAEWCHEAGSDANALPIRISVGGSWFSPAEDCQAISRGQAPPEPRSYQRGLRVARVRLSALWQPLFKGKDLTGLRQVNPMEEGKAEVVVEDGQPVLRLTPKSSQATPELGNYHLRFEYKAEAGAGGGIHQLVGHLLSFRPELMLRSPPRVQLAGGGCSYQEAELRDGRVMAIGARLANDERVDFKNITLNSSSPWQRIEIVRLDDSCLYLVNGKLACALTGIRVTRDGQEKPLGSHAVEFWTDSGPAQFRNIEIREITALPPEILELAAASQPIINPAASTFKTLFNGRNFDGGRVWTSPPNSPVAIPPTIRDEDGQPALVLNGHEGKWNTGIEFARQEGFHLRAQYKWNSGTKLGVAAVRYNPTSGGFESFMIVTRDRTESNGAHHCELNYRVDGAAIESGEIKPKTKLQIKVRAVGDPQRALGQWNQLDLYCVGGQAIHMLNGEIVCVTANTRKVEGDVERRFAAESSP